MTLAAILKFLMSLAKLGASPAVQDLAEMFLAEQAGVPQSVIHAAALAAKDAPEYK